MPRTVPITLHVSPALARFAAAWADDFESMQDGAWASTYRNEARLVRALGKAARSTQEA